MLVEPSAHPTVTNRTELTPSFTNGYRYTEDGWERIDDINFETNTPNPRTRKIEAASVPTPVRYKAYDTFTNSTTEVFVAPDEPDE